MRKIIPLLLLGVLVLTACNRNAGETPDTADPPPTYVENPTPNPLPTPDPEPSSEDSTSAVDEALITEFPSLVGIWAIIGDYITEDGYVEAVYLELRANGTGVFWEGEHIPILWMAEDNLLTIIYRPHEYTLEEKLAFGMDPNVLGEWEDNVRYEFAAQDGNIVLMLHFHDPPVVLTRMDATPVVSSRAEGSHAFDGILPHNCTHFRIEANTQTSPPQVIVHIMLTAAMDDPITIERVFGDAMDWLTEQLTPRGIDVRTLTIVRDVRVIGDGWGTAEIPPDHPLAHIPTFAANQMRAGVYPSEWDDMEQMTWQEFNNALVAAGSNQRLSGCPSALVDRPPTAEAGIFFTPISWNNGVVMIEILWVDSPGLVAAPELRVRAFHPHGVDPTTGGPAHGIHTLYGDPWWQGMNNRYIRVWFAEILWDIIAQLDTALTEAEILAVQRVFNPQ